MAAYAKVGIVAFVVLLLLAWWKARSRGDLDAVAAVAWVGLGALVALGLNQIVGAVVDRARPYAALTDVHVLISRTADSSFPSDHAVAVGAVAAGLFLIHRRLGFAALGLAVLMATARVYVGAHYPADVLAGLGLGAVVVLGGRPLAVPLLRAAANIVERSPLRPLISTAAVRT